MHATTAPASQRTSSPEYRVEHFPWLLFGFSAIAFALLALSTVQGALSSNSATSADYREVRDRELRVAEAAGIDFATMQRGREVYLGTCTACHGPQGQALPNLGKDLAHSEFVAGQSDKQMLMFLMLGRPTWDPANTTKVDMPGKGGNPRLNEKDLADVTQFLRFLQAKGKS